MKWSRSFLWLLAVLVALPLTTAAMAQTRVRLEQGKDWTHPHSGISVPATLGGIARSGATAFAEDNLDIAMQFDSADGEDALSVYIYRNTNGAAPVWFAQAQMAIETRDIYAGPTLAIGTEMVTLPGRDTPAGLRAIYEAGDGSRFRRTGVALFAVGDWYVKMRASSGSRSAEAMAEWMDEVLAAISIPAELAGPRAMAEVADCPSPLVFKGKAKDAKSDLGADLVSGILGMMVLDGELEPTDPEAPPPVWCRDTGDHGELAVFRPDASDNSYLIALGDAGKGVFVGPDAGAQLLGAAEEPSEPRFSVTLHLPGRNVLYVAQDRLPKPERAFELVSKERVSSSVSTWGEENTVEIVTE